MPTSMYTVLKASIVASSVTRPGCVSGLNPVVLNCFALDGPGGQRAEILLALQATELHDREFHSKNKTPGIQYFFFFFW